MDGVYLLGRNAIEKYSQWKKDCNAPVSMSFITYLYLIELVFGNCQKTISLLDIGYILKFIEVNFLLSSTDCTYE